ncbi:MAG: beta-ketoacyl-ACP synthase II [Thermoguttaceae bacterium]|nr:beta-ketoacyl-ACP synthase II [Thermoguttaceae bacterium]MDO4858697.1 beta-ketoacyl-ACP synthase II [Thermoguttaceae bacterium]
MKKRVVITGYGVISCIGNDSSTFWDALLEGSCGLGRITKFDASGYRTQIAGEVKNFNITQYVPFKDSKRMDLFCQYAIAAGDEALLSAGLPKNFQESELDENRVGVLVSSGVGGIIATTTQNSILFEKGPGRVSPLAIPMMIGDSASGDLSIRYGAKGPNFGIVSACASGCHSVGEAYWIIQRGDADIMLAGGTEESVMPLCIAGFASMKAMSTRNRDPLHASRPFDLHRDGFVASEGAAVIVLEDLEHARKRSAKILAEVIGYGATADGFHITSPDPTGEGDARAFQIAMRHAGIQPDEIDYINAHGTSTPLNDKYETLAIKMALGEAAKTVSVSSTKGSTGHALGAAGALETVACVKAIETGIVPPTINFETPDPDCDLNITPNEPVKRPIRVAANNSLGFGGHNAVVIFKKFED